VGKDRPPLQGRAHPGQGLLEVPAGVREPGFKGHPCAPVQITPADPIHDPLGQGPVLHLHGRVKGHARGQGHGVAEGDLHPGQAGGARGLRVCIQDLEELGKGLLVPIRVPVKQTQLRGLADRVGQLRDRLCKQLIPPGRGHVSRIRLVQNQGREEDRRPLGMRGKVPIHPLLGLHDAAVLHQRLVYGDHHRFADRIGVRLQELGHEFDLLQAELPHGLGHPLQAGQRIREDPGAAVAQGDPHQGPLGLAGLDLQQLQPEPDRLGIAQGHPGQLLLGLRDPMGPDQGSDPERATPRTGSKLCFIHIQIVGIGLGGDMGPHVQPAQQLQVIQDRTGPVEPHASAQGIGQASEGLALFRGVREDPAQHIGHPGIGPSTWGAGLGLLVPRVEGPDRAVHVPLDQVQQAPPLEDLGGIGRADDLADLSDGLFGDREPSGKDLFGPARVGMEHLIDRALGQERADPVPVGLVRVGPWTRGLLGPGQVQGPLGRSSGGVRVRRLIQQHGPSVVQLRQGQGIVHLDRVQGRGLARGLDGPGQIGGPLSGALIQGLHQEELGRGPGDLRVRAEGPAHLQEPRLQVVQPGGDLLLGIPHENAVELGVQQVEVAPGAGARGSNPLLQDAHGLGPGLFSSLNVPPCCQERGPLRSDLGQIPVGLHVGRVDLQGPAEVRLRLVQPLPGRGHRAQTGLLVKGQAADAKPIQTDRLRLGPPGRVVQLGHPPLPRVAAGQACLGDDLQQLGGPGLDVLPDPGVGGSQPDLRFGLQGPGLQEGQAGPEVPQVLLEDPFPASHHPGPVPCADVDLGQPEQEIDPGRRLPGRIIGPGQTPPRAVVVAGGQRRVRVVDPCLRVPGQAGQDPHRGGRQHNQHRRADPSHLPVEPLPSCHDEPLRNRSV